MSTFEFPEIPGQRWLATTSQLLEAGATDETLRHMAATGRRVARTVYALRAGPWPEDVLLMAGQLWAGPRAALTGGRALALHGVPLPREVTATRFLVPATQRTRRHARGYLTVRTHTPIHPVVRGGTAVAPLERCLVDAGRFRELVRSEMKGLTLLVLQRRMTTVDRLAQAIEQGWCAGLAGVSDGVVAFRAGAWSIPESVLVNGVAADPRLPTMLANPLLLTSTGERIGVPDGYFPDAGVVAQVHSRTYHDGVDDTGRDRWRDTLEKDTVYARHGLVVVPISPQSIADDLPGVLDNLVAVINARRGVVPDVRVHFWDA